MNESSELTPRNPRALARGIAFYLPQFHPIPENDTWWGNGFTEWTNVVRARPLFRGHKQPVAPADLGYYDLRVPEVRQAQADLASRHGIEAFCYWHYWFDGRQLLERPLEEVVRSGEPRFPFCIGWANQSWSGIWNGEPSRILVEQTYPGPQDHERHFYALLPALADERYVRIEGKLLFFLHRPNEMPDAARFTDQWRALAVKEGLGDFYFVGESIRGWQPEDHGFDAFTITPLAYLSHRSLLARKTTGLVRTIRRGPCVYPYDYLALHDRSPSRVPCPELPMVICRWDNTPRSGRRGFLLGGSTPELFGQAMRSAVAAVQELPPAQRVVFVKSWNEWAEGNYLEPDQYHGHEYLEALADQLLGGSGASGGAPRGSTSTP